MKVRMFAVVSILALASWLPAQAQQPATPASADDSAKAAKHDGCCPATKDSAQSATDCCHGNAAADGKSASCPSKNKEMACCPQETEALNLSMNCCKDMKNGQCSAKDGKACCPNMAKKDGKACCTISDKCPAQANGK